MSTMAKATVILALTFMSSSAPGFTLKITGRGTNCVPAHEAYVTFDSNTVRLFSGCLCDSQGNECILKLSRGSANRHYTPSASASNKKDPTDSGQRNLDVGLFSCVVMNFDKAESDKAYIKCTSQCIRGDNCNVDNGMCSIVRFPKTSCKGVREILLIWRSLQTVEIESGSDEDIQVKQVSCTDSCVVSSAVLAQISEDRSKGNTALILGLVCGSLVVIVFISVGIVILVSFIRAKKNSKPSTAMDRQVDVPRLEISYPAPASSNVYGNAESPRMSNQATNRPGCGHMISVGIKNDTQDRSSTENAPDSKDKKFKLKPKPIGNYNNVHSVNTPSDTRNDRLEIHEEESSQANRPTRSKEDDENNYSRLRQPVRKIRNPYDQVSYPDEGPNMETPISNSDPSDASGYSLAQVIV